MPGSGQEHYRKEPDGTFTELDPTFHDLVAYHAHARFAKGDSFVAEGYTHPYEYERDGQSVQGKEFVAKKIGHDLARTSYEVDRIRGECAGEQEAPAQSARLDAPERQEPHRSSARATPALGL